MSEKAITEKSKKEKAESLPEGWKRVRLGEVIEDIGDGGTPPRDDPRNFGGSINWVVIDDIQKRIHKTAETLTEEGLKHSNAKIWKKGAVILSFGATIGEVGIAEVELATKQGIAGIIPKNQVLINIFLYYILKYKKNTLLSLANQTTLKEVRPNVIKEKVDFLLPSLPEQQKIAEILETVDNAIEKTDAIIEKYRRIKKGLMADLLTGKIRLIPIDHAKAEGEESSPLSSAQTKKFVIGDKTFVAVPNQKWKNSPIGKIPEDWEVRKLGEIVNIFDSKRIPLDEEYRANIKGEYPYCGATGIIDYINDYIFEGEFVLIAEDGGKFGAFEDTAYIINGKFWVNNHAHIVKGKENFLENRYLKNFINYIDVTTYISGSTREKLNQAILRSILLPLPPLPEQQIIADVLSQVDEVIEKEIQYKEKLERIKKGLMEDLLTGKVRVNHLIRGEKNEEN
jgi:type I restriction enzyme S subunit